jgi:hypothetical protein
MTAASPSHFHNDGQQKTKFLMTLGAFSQQNSEANHGSKTRP